MDKILKLMGVWTAILLVGTGYLRTFYMCFCIITENTPILKRLEYEGYNYKIFTIMLIVFTGMIYGFMQFKAQNIISKVLLLLGACYILLLVYTIIFLV